MAQGKKLDGEARMFKIRLFKKDIDFLQEHYPNTSVSEIVRLLLERFINDARRAYEQKIRSDLTDFE